MDIVNISMVWRNVQSKHFILGCSHNVFISLGKTVSEFMNVHTVYCWTVDNVGKQWNVVNLCHVQLSQRVDLWQKALKMSRGCTGSLQSQQGCPSFYVLKPKEKWRSEMLHTDEIPREPTMDNVILTTLMMQKPDGEGCPQVSLSLFLLHIHDNTHSHTHTHIVHTCLIHEIYSPPKGNPFSLCYKILWFFSPLYIFLCLNKVFIVL